MNSPASRRAADRMDDVSPSELHWELFLAAQECDLPLVLALLERGADARREWQTHSGAYHTPLTAALASGHPDAAACAEALLPHSDPRWRTRSGTRPLSAALSGGRVEGLRALLPWLSDEDLTGGSLSVLFVAAHDGRAQMVRELASRMGPHEAGENARCSPLWIAIERGHTDCAQALIEAGASVKERDAGGVTLLMMAAQNDRLEAIRLLLAAGADAKAQCKRGSTALMAAALRPSVELLATFLPHSDPMAVDARGENALMRFCHARPIYESDSQKTMILARACGLSARNALGQTAMDILAGANLPAVRSTLIGMERARREREALMQAQPGLDQPSARSKGLRM